MNTAVTYYGTLCFISRLQNVRQSTKKYYLLKQLNGLAHNTSLSHKLANEPQKLAFIFSLNHKFGFYSVPKAALFQPDFN